MRFELGEEQARERLDKVLTQLLPDTSRATIQRWIDENRVSVDGEISRSRRLVGPGQVIDVDPGLPPPTTALPDPSIEVDVLYEDEHLLVLNKPAGLVVHPARGHAEGTLVNALLARPGFERAPSDPRDPDGQLRPGIVHRIDKDTSGILVVAKLPAAREGLKAQLNAHSMEREYVAITIGVPEAGTIDSLHGRHPRSRVRYTSSVRKGKRAVTHVRVVERLAEGRAALVQCRLETGRTHQIRVHLSERGKAPILGDLLYGGTRGPEPIRELARELHRQALHAGVLGFVHPITGESHRFEVPMPDDMQQVLERLRALAEPPTR